MPEGVLKDLLTGIWSDECGHAHFGWRQLSTWLPNDRELKQRLGEIQPLHRILEVQNSRTYHYLQPLPKERNTVCVRRKQGIVLCHCRGDHHSKSRNIRHPCTVGMDESFYGKDGMTSALSNDLEYPIAKNGLPTKDISLPGNTCHNRPLTGYTMSTEHHSSADKPIVIVGGGVTGLVTAHLLLERGQKVIVVEKLPFGWIGSVV